MTFKKYQKEIDQLAITISDIVNSAKAKIVREVNSEIILAYWQIGKLIQEIENQQSIDNQSSRQLITDLARTLTQQIGKGYNRSNLTYMRLFYKNYSSGVTLSHHLSWSHYIELLKVDDEIERSFYEKQSVNEKWSVRELRRQKNSALFQRLALSKDKNEILKLSKEGQILRTESDLIKDPYVLEFLDLPETGNYTEQQLEKKIIENLQSFLLELGKGFAFIANQYRITLNNRHYSVDLVFYHRILKCFVLIDLKIGEARHYDIGQMNMYLNYIKKEENVEDDNEPIGIILARSKDEIMIEYATGGLSNKVFVSKYQTHLPDKEVLLERVKLVLDEEE